MIEPEQYNEYGDIVVPEKPVVYERTMSAYDIHIIHRTKDLFEGDCTYCHDDHNKMMRRINERPIM